ncbi:MAG: sulfotransferase [Chitinophagales bacterium]|nr:sulfotransferase [Chitinophagales bacterium]
MVYGSASFYYVRYKIMGDVIVETYRRFQWKIWLLSVLFIFLWSLHQFVSLLFRLLDEIFHRGYKRTEVKQPVFIIANPRSGTTFLHRLMAMDTERFVYTKNAHTFFMSSSFVQFYNVIRWTDRKVMRGMLRKLVDRLDDVFWGGWDDIHPMGFNKAEEDELVFAQTLMSPGVFIPFPYFHLHNDNKFLDDEDERVRNNVMDFYEGSIKRFVFRSGKEKTYLAKNVMSTARFKSLLKKFPDAKIIYIARHPYDAVPSMASMFTAMYNFYLPEIPKDHPSKSVWARYGIDFFKYSKEMRKEIPPSQFIAVTYNELLADPQQTVQKIYKHFGWQLSDNFNEQLSKEQKRSSTYKSAHEYSLQEYGLSKEYIYNQLGDIMDEYGFEKEF